MVWSEYLNDHYEHVPNEEPETPDGPSWEVVDFEDWVDWYEPHISNMWNDMLAYRQDAGIVRIVGVDMDYWDFARFLYTVSDKRAIPIG